MGKKALKPPPKKKPPSAPAAAPPVPAAAELTAAPARGRAGAPNPPPATKAHHDPSRSVVPAPSITAAPVEVQCVSPLFCDCAENMIQLPGTTLKKLGIPPGELVSLTTSASRGDETIVVLVAAKSKDLVAPRAALHAETLALLGGATVADVEPYDGELIELTAASGAVLLERLEQLSDASAAAKQASFAPRQLEAAFTKRFNGQCVFDHMVAQLSIAGVSVSVSTRLPSAAPVARVTPLTRVSAFPLAAAAVSESAAPHGGAERQDDADTAAASSSQADVGSNHVLHTGPRGTGKSHALKALTTSSSKTVIVRPEEIMVLGPAAGASALHDVFAHAAATAPCVVQCDDMHIAFGRNAPSEEGKWKKRLLAAALAKEIETASAGVTFAGACISADLLDGAIGANRRLQHVPHEPPASWVERAEVLNSIVRAEQLNGSCVSVTSEQVTDIAKSCLGFVQADLAQAVSLAKVLSFETCSRFEVSPDSLARAVKRTRPSAIRNFDVSIPEVKWTDIGGSDEAKLALQECVQWSLGKQREVFQLLGVNPPRGVLLYGPPGCSKTMLAKALANESSLNFIAVKGPEVFSKWVGDSEKAVREIFSKARAVSPCVVFIDELDGMCGHRGSGGVSDRVISQFLTELDGLPSAIAGKPDDIVFVAATNRPDNIDPAVLRPGRVDRFVYVGLPSREERCQIASIGLRRTPVADDVTADAIAERTEGYTGAEVIAVCKEAAYQCIAEDEEASVVSWRHVEAALERTKPRVSASDVAWYSEWAAKQRK